MNKPTKKKEPKPDEVFKDKPENEVSDEVKDIVEILDKAVEKADIADEALVGKPNEEKSVETDPDPKPVEEDEEVEPLYQRKVYIIDLNNIGLKIEGEGSLVVDVMSIDKETQKATVKNGDLTMEVPKEFLF